MQEIMMIKKIKPAKIIFILLGIISCVYGLTVNAIVSSVHWFNFIFCIFGAVLILIGLFCEKLKKLPKRLKLVLLLLILAVAVNFAAAESKIIKASKSVPSDDAGWVLILGAKVNESGVSLEFARRIDAGLSYAQAHEDCTVVTTGGKGQDEPESEGLAAARRLIAGGLPADRIITEQESDSTYQNFEYALKLMRENGYEDTDRVVIVSSAFHLFRAGKIAASAGIENVSFLGVTGKPFLLPQYYVREYCAYILEALKGHY